MSVAGEKNRPIGRLGRLDGLRGLLALYVMFGHLAPFLPLPRPMGRLVEVVLGHGMAAVELFFALSGLVIVQSMARFEGAAIPFLAARARRLLPVYLLVLAASAAILAAGSPYAFMPWLGAAAFQIWPAGLPPHLAAEFGIHTILAQGMLPHAILPYAEFALLGPAWSLSTEAQFYLVVAALMMPLRDDRKGLARLAWLFLALAVIARCYAIVVPPPWWFGRAFLPNQAAYFALGIAAARFWREERALWPFVAATAVAVALGAAGGLGKALPPLAWMLAVAIQRAPTTRPLRPFARILGSAPMLWLGSISYPLYLVNEPVARGLALLLGRVGVADPALFAALWLPAALVASVAAAASLHYTVELSFMRPRRALMPAAVPAAEPS